MGGSDLKEFTYNVGNLNSVLRLGRSPREGNGYSLKYPCLENSMDRGYSPWGCKELDMTEQETQHILKVGPLGKRTYGKLIVLSFGIPLD